MVVGDVPSDRPAHVTDRVKFGDVLARVREIKPSRIFSSHLPAADGTSLDEFLTILEMVPDAEPFMPPDAEQFAALIEAMAAEQQGVPDPRSGESETTASTV